MELEGLAGGNTLQPLWIVLKRGIQSVPLFPVLRVGLSVARQAPALPLGTRFVREASANPSPSRGPGADPAPCRALGLCLDFPPKGKPAGAP